MQVNYEFSHEIDLVFKALTDPGFLKQRALSLGSLEANCSAKGAAPNCQLELIRKREINIPAVLSAFLKKVQTAVTNEHWSQQGDQYICTNSTEIDGAPLSISGKMTLSPTATGCLLSANFETKAKIMFGKKKLQEYAGKTIAKEIELECEYTAKQLAA